MQRVLAAFARTAAGDPAGLDDARDGWTDLAPEQQALLAALGRLLANAGDGRRPGALPDVLEALAGRDLDRARRQFHGLDAGERVLIAKIGRYLADHREATMPMLGAFDGVGDQAPAATSGGR